MGFLSNIFSEKAMLYEGPDEKLYEELQDKLREAGIYMQAFEKNQKAPKCDGNCGTCPMAAREGKLDLSGKEMSSLEKFGAAYDNVTDILGDELPYRIYDVYVKKSELARAKEICGMA